MKARSGSQLHVALYRSLYVLLALSIVSFALGSKYPAAWETYRRVYFYLIMGYIWYVFLLLFIGERKKDANYQYDGGSIAVLMPVFNEEPKLFMRALQSVIWCKGNKKIFVLDDGSTKPMNRKALREYCNKHGVVLHCFPKNRGKRHVLTDAIKAYGSSYDFVVTIDSDTILDENALVNIVSAFQDPRVGAASGEVKLLNERKNWLTKMVAAYYWIALDICKQSQSTFGYVACCSGCLSAYRGSTVSTVIEEYGSQMFAGELCTHSEDRHLTNLILREGYNVKFVESAISYTYTPETIPTFLKQQMRWKRGYVREATFLLMFAWRTHPILFIQTVLYDLTMPFIIFGLAVSMIVSVVLSPISLVAIVPSYILFAIIRNLPLLLRQPKKLPGMIMFTVFSDVFLYWQNIYALFTMKRKGWLTR